MLHDILVRSTNLLVSDPLFSLCLAITILIAMVASTFFTLVFIKTLGNRMTYAGDEASFLMSLPLGAIVGFMAAIILGAIYVWGDPTTAQPTSRWVAQRVNTLMQCTKKDCVIDARLIGSKSYLTDRIWNRRVLITDDGQVFIGADNLLGDGHHAFRIVGATKRKPYIYLTYVDRYAITLKLDDGTIVHVPSRLIEEAAVPLSTLKED